MSLQYKICSDLDHFDLIKLGNFLSSDGQFALLLSGSNYDSAENSFLALFPYETLVVEEEEGENPWETVKKKLHSINQKHDLPEWIGYFNYEMGAYQDQTVVSPYFRNAYPNAYFQRYGLILRLNHRSKILTVRCNNDCPEIKLQQFIDRSFWKKHKKFPELDDFQSKIELTKPLESLDSYSEKIKIVKEHIIAGDIYQINLSQECIYTGEFNALQLFKKNFEKNPAPFSAYLKLNEFHTIVSTSPERLLSRKEDILETRPIKGTIERGKTKEKDLENKEYLLASEKERAELLMITDLMRNDLSKVSVPGSVKTEKIWHCEEYENVFHLLSIIKSKVVPSIHPIDVVRAVFPGGSITGCPKMRAMEIIHQVENSPRGIYTGSIGYFSGNGDFDFNIAIRTLDIVKNNIRLRLGGGIVFDSEAVSEYQETLHKGTILFDSLVN